MQLVNHLPAAISLWGLGQLPLNESTSQKINIDRWLEKFLLKNQDHKTIEELARHLSSELQVKYDIIGEDIPLGLHICGYEHILDKFKPVFYHFRNVEGGGLRDFEFHVFTSYQEFDHNLMNHSGPWWKRIRNGAFGEFAVLSSVLEQAQKYLEKEYNYPITTTIEGRGRYLLSWIRFMSDLYESTGDLKTIGVSLCRNSSANNLKINLYLLYKQRKLNNVYR